MNNLYARFGELLKVERERRGLALSVVSAELKIPEDTLLKIESGESESLPAGPYLALFSKAYAEFLGIDYAKTIEAIREDLGESLEPAPLDGSAHIPTLDEPRLVVEHRIATGKTPRRRVGLAVGGSVVAIAILVGIFLVFWGSKDGRTSQPEVIAPAEDSVNVEHESTATQIDLEEFAEDSAAIVGPDSLRLTITAHDGSWATIISDDDTALFQMLTPERQYNVAALDKLVVTLGVPEVVDILLDGYPANLANSRTGDISRVRIDHDNRDQFYLQPERDSVIDSVAPPERTDSARP